MFLNSFEDLIEDTIPDFRFNKLPDELHRQQSYFTYTAPSMVCLPIHISELQLKHNLHWRWKVTRRILLCWKTIPAC